MNKMFVAVRRDLGNAYKFVQGAHALAQFSLEHTHIFNEWNNQTIVFLDTDDIDSLLILSDKLLMHNIKHSIFVEPDIGNQFTAVSFVGTDKIKNITKKYKLAK